MKSIGCGAALVALLVALVGCLETEERIVIREDGSATVQIHVTGDIKDLASGWPIPSAAPWTPVGRMSEAWWRQGAPLEASALRRLADRAGSSSGPESARAANKLELSVRGAFSSAEAIPGSNLPQGALFREAHLRRLTRLGISRGDGGRIYRFERIYEAGSRAAWRVWHWTEETFPDDLRQRISGDEPVGREDWLRVATIVAHTLADQAERCVREAWTPIVVEGREPWSSSLIERTLARARGVSAGVASEEAILTIAAAEEARKERRRSGRPEPIEQPDLFGDLERDLRAGLRAALDDLLRDELSAETRTGFLTGLDRSFIAFDAVRDAGDETFRVSVTMPGLVLSGNYDHLEANRASWTISGKTLQDQDVRLAVTSILE